MFARETSDSLTSLVKSIDAEIAKTPRLRSFVVVLTNDADKTSSTLSDLATKNGIKSIPLTLVDNPKGPAAYSIAPDADITVMMWKGINVKVNHAFPKGGMTADDVKIIVSELPKILGE